MSHDRLERFTMTTTRESEIDPDILAQVDEDLGDSISEIDKRALASLLTLLRGGARERRSREG